MKININETFYSVASHDARLRDVLVAFGFEPMASDVTFNTVGRAIQLKPGLAHIKKSLIDLNNCMVENGLEVEFYDGE